MASVCLAAALLFQSVGMYAGVPAANPGGVFVTQQAAHGVLQRLRRYNSGHFEEIKVGNLERECKEETCTLEEAREVFEDEEKTMEFWAGYVDGDQCNPPPCQNDGVCQDGVNSYICWCGENFSGKNCDIEISKQCSVNNGGCSHFCVMEAELVKCRCAHGYTLAADLRTCEPTGLFSCGRLGGSAHTPRSSNRTHAANSSVEEDVIPEELLDYDYNLTADLSLEVNASLGSEVMSRPARSASNHSAPPLASFFPTLPSIMARDNSDQRIVGGDLALPGEVPWQVALMTHSDSRQAAEVFCGGSLLSDVWVITAAHCLLEARKSGLPFFVRAGEHDVFRSEGPERDHAVAEEHVHHLYDYQKSPYNHDVALLKLAAPVELSPHRLPICFGPKDFIESLLQDSAGSLVSGWGLINFGGPQASKLQKVEVPLVSRSTCKASSRQQVTRFMFCAGFQSQRKDSCQGDSGGPHATKYQDTWFLTGIVSWGEGCAKDGKYGVYTRLSRYYRWISNTTAIRAHA
ncbi:coagulation factor IXb isoform X1 [Entelurus aequoreus]|uniref:coagulation factor IXb isoform X1 n=1 Tax=Entelurus aequoreus TaxID=161455 RepID=UPI002B1E0116|nr:coagulation factor IXb isoform X1 [Entelurus aequoreus]